jgi:hypothetical protein
MATELLQWNCEYTDTFGGAANYSWLRCETIKCAPNVSRRWLMREARHKLGIRGLRGRWTDHGDMLEFRPYRCCTVAFVTLRQ